MPANKTRPNANVISTHTPESIPSRNSLERVASGHPSRDSSRRPSFPAIGAGAGAAFFTNPYRQSNTTDPDVLDEDPNERFSSGGSSPTRTRTRSTTTTTTTAGSSDSEMSDSTLLEPASGGRTPALGGGETERSRRNSETSIYGASSPDPGKGQGVEDRWDSWSGLPLPTTTSGPVGKSSPGIGLGLSGLGLGSPSTSSWRISTSKLRLWVDQARHQLVSGPGPVSSGSRAGLGAMLSGRRGAVLFLAAMVLFVFGWSQRGIAVGGVTIAIARGSHTPKTFTYNGDPTWSLPKLVQMDSYSPLARNASTPLREIDISSEPLPLEATLSERLLAWERAPGGRGPGVHLGLDGEYHEEVELGRFQAWNLESCANIAPQMNTHMVQYAAQVWSSFDRTTLHNTRMTLIEHMRAVEREGLLKNVGVGRGIVMVAGNADTLQRVIWSTQYMRNKGTTLPVQVYHFPGEEPAPGDGIYDQLRDLNIELVPVAGQSKDEGKTKSYHLKAIAVVQCPFREVLYMDSDNIPTRDPEYMFDSPSYKRLGIWATYDYWKTSGNNAIWAILGIRCRDEWEMEAGQIFVDKARHLDVFHLTKFMLEHHEYFFYFSDGDKDIFRWALLALRKRWGVPGRWVGVAALPGATASGDHCGHTMLQHDAYGESLFVHYNLLKQIPSGVGRGFTWGKTKRLPLFNSFPPPANHAHANELAYSDHDLALPGLGDIDCDMLADADDEGHARAPAREEIRRRAARERGIKARYHGGWISALCIDLDYEDPRPEPIRKAEEKQRELREKLEKAAEEAGLPPPPPIDPPVEGAAVQPDWRESPIETVFWRDSDLLRDMEANLYDMGFKPSGPGF